MIRPIHLVLVLALVASTAPAIAEDGFAAIHRDNQQIGSAVAEFWREQTAPAAAQPAPDGFMAVYMGNQKIGSPVAAYWLLQAQSDVEIHTAALSR